MASAVVTEVFPLFPSPWEELRTELCPGEALSLALPWDPRICTYGTCADQVCRRFSLALQDSPEILTSCSPSFFFVIKLLSFLDT